MIQIIAGWMAFHFTFSKTKLKFKMWFLLDLSIKHWFQAFLGRGNESRTWRNEMALEIGVWKVWISWSFKGLLFCREEHVFKGEILGATIWWVGALRSTVAITRLLIESSRLSQERPIIDEGLWWVHVFQFEWSRRLIIRWILIQRSRYVEESTNCKWSQPL